MVTRRAAATCLDRCRCAERWTGTAALRGRAWLGTLSMVLGLQAAVAAPADGAMGETGRGQGIAVAIGGALKLDNDAVWQRLVDLAGGPGARYVVLATAAGNPERSGAQIAEALNRRGAVADVLPLAPRWKGRDARADARDPALVARVLASRGVYFSGGAQERIVDTLFDPDGRPTPVLDAIWRVYRRGGVVAGSSAGAAIMSTTMFRDAQGVLEVMQAGPGGLRVGKEIDRGLGFVGSEVFVDQHFLKRGRFGRMLPLMLRQGYKLGIGVDENTAAVFSGDSVEVVGYKGVLVADLADATSDPAQPAFNLRQVRLSYLDRGDRYDLKRRITTPSPEKLRDLRIDPNAADFKPYHEKDAFFADVLGDTAVVNLMSRLIDSRQREIVGLAFGAPGSAQAGLGFEFRFRKGPDSLGHYTGAFGGEDYTVSNILLDVTPVRMSQPLYTPLDAPASAPADAAASPSPAATPRPATPAPSASTEPPR